VELRTKLQIAWMRPIVAAREPLRAHRSRQYCLAAATTLGDFALLEYMEPA
jgi:hypothetical protein